MQMTKPKGYNTKEQLESITDEELDAIHQEYDIMLWKIDYSTAYSILLWNIPKWCVLWWINMSWLRFIRCRLSSKLKKYIETWDRVAEVKDAPKYRNSSFIV